MGNPRTFQIRIDSDLKAAWQEEASARGLSLADLLREAVSLYAETVPRPEVPRFQNGEIERGREQMKEFFNRLGFEIGDGS